MKPAFRRRIFLIDKPFQYAFLLRFTGAVVAGVLLSFAILVGYYLIRYSESNLALKFFYVSGQPGSGLQETTLLALVVPSLAISALLSVVLTIIFGIFYSHRIAGPLYNLKRVLQQVRMGQLDQEVHLRKGDEFHDLAEEVTQTITWVREKLHRR